MLKSHSSEWLFLQQMKNMAQEKILAICIRDESYEDFISIGKRIHRMDNSIIVNI